MDRGELEKLSTIVGVDFIAYASASPPSVIKNMLAGKRPISRRVRSTIEELGFLSERVPASPNMHAGDEIGQATILDIVELPRLMGMHHEGNTVGNAIRLAGGASLPALGNYVDDVTTELCRMARNVYPVLLLPKSENEPFSDYMRINMQISFGASHLDRQPLYDAVQADSTLSRLYNGSSQDQGSSGFNYVLNTGLGSGQNLYTLPVEIMVPAYYRTVFAGKFTPEKFIENVADNVRMFKSLIEGQPVTISTYVALRGVTVPDKVHIELPWGTLRAPTPHELELLDSRSRFADSILVSAFDLKLRVRQGGAFDEDYPSYEAARAERELSATLTSASLMLTLGSEPRVHAIATIVLPPFAPTPPLHFPPEGPGVVPRALDKNARARLRRISETLGSDSSKKYLTIALRRTLTAISRRDPLDGFVDAFIAMESLFGSDRDTTYILSSAVGKFLGKDFTEREAIKKEITRLYRTRSQIVHGADSPSPSKVEEIRHRVIDLNIAALQRLLHHRRDLIGLTAQKRSLAILLGAKRSR